jgi:hypothetical protein
MKRWTQPTGRAERTEYYSLKAELKVLRGKQQRVNIKARVAEIEARLDLIAAKEPSSDTPPTQPKDWKQELVDRVEARRKNGPPFSSGTPAKAGSFTPTFLAAEEIEARWGASLRVQESSKYTPPTGPSAPSPALPSRPVPAPRLPKFEPEEEPHVDAITQAGMDLRAKAEVILTLDGWLTLLSQHNGGAMKEEIIAAIVGEVLQRGVAGSEFLCRTYERLRPKGLRDFPVRKF